MKRNPLLELMLSIASLIIKIAYSSKPKGKASDAPDVIVNADGRLTYADDTAAVGHSYTETE